jgi:hypothetical protein
MRRLEERLGENLASTPGLYHPELRGSSLGQSEYLGVAWQTERLAGRRAFASLNPALPVIIGVSF